MSVEKPMGKLIQICASQNDLFGLDDAGRAYQYNFKMSTWMHLDRDRSAQAGSPPADGQPSASPMEVRVS